MSWIERIKNELIIVTGDGKEYRPSYLNPQREKQFHVAPFEFIEKPGTLVHRGKHKGRVYPLEIYFQGEDNIDIAKAFDESTNDPRPWELSHPLYDAITVQPVRIHQDNTRMNVTKFTCTVIETITEKLPTSSVAPKDQLQNELDDVSETISTEFENENFTTADSAILTESTSDVYNEGKKGLPDSLTADSYFNKFKSANAAISNITAAPLAAMRKMQAVIDAPSQFAASVQNRLDTLESQYNKLRTSIDTLTGRKDKTAFEAFAGGTVVAMLGSLISEPTANTIGEVLALAVRIGTNYGQFMSDLDLLQDTNAGVVDSYVPNGEIIQKLTRATNFALAFLQEIALEKAIEHSIVLEEDSNVILLTHRFYGLDPGDEKLDELIDINDIGLNEMLRIRKGRTIKYLK